MATMRLNHAVLYVRNAERSATWYAQQLGFERVSEMPGGVFLRCPGSENDHDLALFTVGDAAGASTAGHDHVGLYHLAWEVPTLGQLAEMRSRLATAGAIVGQSDHVVSKSIYCIDPDGLEFELMWAVPPELLGPENGGSVVAPLDLPAEIERYGADTPGRVTHRAHTPR